MKITRAQFQNAIEAGITAAPGLTGDQRDRLRVFGINADSFGTNFSNGCPLAATGVYDELDQFIDNETIRNFAWIFDDEWTEDLSPDDRILAYNVERVEVA